MLWVTDPWQELMFTKYLIKTELKQPTVWSFVTKEQHCFPKPLVCDTNDFGASKSHQRCKDYVYFQLTITFIRVVVIYYLLSLINHNNNGGC